MSLSTNLNFSSNLLRYNYTSFTTLSSVIEFGMDTTEKNILKKTEVVDESFKESNYVSERIFAESHDGVKIPISIVRHVDTELSESTPLLLYGYGSYGITNDPRFSSTRLSLLNRGFVYATAHIRGSQYYGRKWYEDGKLFKKKNTFFDFVACAKHLINIKHSGYIWYSSHLSFLITHVDSYRLLFYYGPLSLDNTLHLPVFCNY